MDGSRSLNAEPAAAPQAPAIGFIFVFALVLFAAACGSSQTVATAGSAAEVAADPTRSGMEEFFGSSTDDDAARRSGPRSEPAGDLVDSDVLAEELRHAAVQALQLPEPVVEVAVTGDGVVSLGIGNTWRTVDLTIRSVEQTPTEVVVFATPVRAEWELGDGHQLRCNEFGDIDTRGGCVHAYPEQGRFEGELDLVWGLSWSLDGEHLGIFETTSTGASFVVDR